MKYEIFLNYQFDTLQSKSLTKNRFVSSRVPRGYLILFSRLEMLRMYYISLMSYKDIYLKFILLRISQLTKNLISIYVPNILNKDLTIKVVYLINQSSYGLIIVPVCTFKKVLDIKSILYKKFAYQTVRQISANFVQPRFLSSFFIKNGLYVVVSLSWIM